MGGTTTFSEVMSGSVRLVGEPQPRTMRIELDVVANGLLLLWKTTDAVMTGRVTFDGIAAGTPGTGFMMISPIKRRRLRYQLTFRTDDGRTLRLDGWKTVRLTQLSRSMTTLPVTLYDERDSVIGDGVLHFATRDLPRFLAGFRYRRAGTGNASDDAASVWPSRWRGQSGRLEVWYSTFTDPESGTGAWVHHEIVAPADGSAAYQHGWVAVFPAGEEPLVARFGPDAATPHTGADVAAAAGHTLRLDQLKGDTANAAWSLAVRHDGATLGTFPQWAWERELLPAAHVVATPGATFDGTVHIGQREFTFRGAPGASSRIYGHGNALRWAWLHADLGDGAVLEIVTAVSTRPLLRRLKPLTFLRLRTADGDWPVRAGLLQALRFRAEIGMPEWHVRGRIGDRSIEVHVRLPERETVELEYAEPHGERVVCRNSERADATVTVLRRRDGRWSTEQSWQLDGTAHAEVGGHE